MPLLKVVYLIAFCCGLKSLYELEYPVHRNGPLPLPCGLVVRIHYGLGLAAMYMHAHAWLCEFLMHVLYTRRLKCTHNCHPWCTYIANQYTYNMLSSLFLLLLAFPFLYLLSAWACVLLPTFSSFAQTVFISLLQHCDYMLSSCFGALNILPIIYPLHISVSLHAVYCSILIIVLFGGGLKSCIIFSTLAYVNLICTRHTCCSSAYITATVK
jgi:hypothetical protein